MTPPNQRKRPVTTRYLIGTAEHIALLLVLLLIDYRSYIKIDFDTVGRGLFADKQNLGLFVPIFATPLILSLVPYFRKQYGKEIEGTQYGYPEENMPSTYRQFSLFFFYMIGSVVFEELLCRQVGFYALNAVFALKGDMLLIITSAVFAFAHPYKKMRHILGVFISGLLFGKAYQISGTILLPMALHLLVNAPLLVLALHRIKKQYI